MHILKINQLMTIDNPLNIANRCHLEYIESGHGDEAECHDGDESKNGALNPPRPEHAAVPPRASTLPAAASTDGGVGGEGARGGLDRSGESGHSHCVRFKLLDTVAKVVRHLEKGEFKATVEKTGTI